MTLTQASKQEGHSVLVLQLIESNDPSYAGTRQAASIRFKNIVKKGWDPDVSSEEICGEVSLNFAHRSNIKLHRVTLKEL